MANVLLVSYAGYPYTPGSLCPDNGLATLASVLMEAGHDVLILDYGTVETMRRLYPDELSPVAASAFGELAQSQGSPSQELVEKIGTLDQKLSAYQARQVQGIASEIAETAAEIEPVFIGFKLWNGDGFTGSVTIAEHVRRQLPSVKIFAGGPHATWGGSAIFRYTDVFDGIVVGEAEDKIVRLVESAAGDADAGQIPGVLTAADQQKAPTNDVDLDDIPRPVYDDEVYPAMAGDQKLKMLVVDDSRGCPYCCAFCKHPYESGRRLRTRSAHRIVDELQAVIDKFGLRTFRFAGSSTPGTLMAEVADEINSRDLDVLYTSFAHFENTVPDYYELMQQSGMYAMFFGLESGSERILREAAQKPLDLEVAGRMLTEAGEAGIRTAVSMIVPMPFETEKTLEESFEFLTDTEPDSVPLQFPGLLPGTRWFRHAERFNFEVDRDTYVESNLDYKFKMLFPPAFWQPLGYTVNGMDFEEFTSVTADFTRRLEQAGILTGMPDENLMMAHVSGMGAREFRDGARMWAATGDADAVQQFVQRFNNEAVSEQRAD